MLKLYKRQLDRIFYWETWEDEEHIIVHYGLAGENGQEDSFSRNNESRAGVAHEEARRRLEGYTEQAENSHFWLTIRYQIEGWGTDADLAKRHHIEALMDECLGWTGLGHCDGGDIGSGEMNIFCVVVSPPAAVAPIVRKLEAHNYLEGASIALEPNEDEGEVKVLWPRD